MIGAIAGDIIGSEYEFNNTDKRDFQIFGRRSTYTDDSILTCATADVILDAPLKATYSQYYFDYAKSFPNRGWGGNFALMVKTGSLKPYNSYGNGSAMRVSPIGWAYHDYDDVLVAAKESSECTHNHPEGIKGAQATALAIFLARTGSKKRDIIKEVEKLGYDLSKPLNSFDRSFDQLPID